MNLFEKIKKKISSQDFNVGIIGLGYVGLPLLLRFAEKGFSVTGIDLDKNKVSSLSKKESYIKHIPNELLKKSLTKNKYKFTTDFKHASLCDALIICVPTPLNEHRDPDLSYIVSTVDSLLPNLRKGQIISLESTTYPGTTEEEIVERLQKNKFSVGKNIFAVYSPEREDPGNKNFTTQNIPKIIGGHTKECLELGTSLYKKIIDEIVPVKSIKTAEMTKLLENIHSPMKVL